MLQFLKYTNFNLKFIFDTNMHSITDSPPPSPSIDQSVTSLDNTDVGSGNENNENRDSDDSTFVTPEKNENPTITAAEIIKGKII